MEDSGLPLPVIEVSLSCLERNGLPPNVYVLLHWKFHNNYPLPNVVFETTINEPNVLERLEEAGFIKITGEEDFELRQPALNLFKTDSLEEKWLEFLGKFPLKVPARNGGTRALKVGDPSSKANAKLKKKYVALIKSNPDKHEHIIKVLEAEMEMRRTSNNLQYMNAMEAWLNQCCYDKYAYLLEEEKNDNVSDYGNRIE